MNMNNPVVNLPAGAAHGAGAERAAPRAPTLPAPAARHGAFWPLTLGLVALVGWFAFQSVVLFGERDALQTAHAGQQQTVDNAGKLRAMLDALASDTQRMADAGNPNAGALVAELRRRGITITVPAAATPAASGDAASAAGR